MQIEPYYNSVYLFGIDTKLEGIPAELHIEFSIDATALDLSQNADDFTDAIVEINYTYKEGDTTHHSKSQLSIWSDSIYDLLDSSICARDMIFRQDTTITLLDVESETRYTHRAQWMYVMSIHELTINFASKNARKFVGKRYVGLCFHNDSSNYNSFIKYSMFTTPLALAEFAKQLRDTYEAISAISANL